MEYEYAIMMKNVVGLHRGPWSEEECNEWIQTWLDDLTENQTGWIDLFYIVRRPVGEWERLDS